MESLQAIQRYLNEPTPEVVNVAFDEAGVTFASDPKTPGLVAAPRADRPPDVRYLEAVEDGWHWLEAGECA